MKFSAAIVLSLSTFAFAQSIADLPSCSISCFTTAIASSGCGATDTKCQCTTGKDAITKTITPCLLKACSQDDATKTATVSAQICNNVLNGGSASGSGSGSTASKTGSSTASGSTSSAAAQASSNAGSFMKPMEMMGAGVCLVAAGMLTL